EGQYVYTILVKSPIPIGYVNPDHTVTEFNSYNIGSGSEQYGANLADIGIHRYIVTELTGLCYILYGSFGVAYDAPTAVGEFPRENSANSPPKAQDQSKDTNKNTAVDITLEATDADNDPLTYIIVSYPTNGTLDITEIPKVTYTPDPGYAGKDSFTFKANDGIADSNIATVTITIKNRVPEAKDQSVTTDRNKPVGITLEATDEDNDPLTYSIVSYPTNGTLSGTPPNVIYTPNAGYTGDDSFTFKANDGIEDSKVATVSITIEAPPVNHKPAALEQSLTTMENTPVDIILMAVDEDADPLRYIIVDDPDHGTLSGTPPNLTYTPDTDYTGTDSFTFKANDGEFDSNVAVVNITVSAVNHAP
ncbi:MAG: tandem-95 repeat protein, partial [Thermoplasmata archaeon]|nr:tandem-95 repeat protein [Thermoplasmata archaeon]